MKMKLLILPLLLILIGCKQQQPMVPNPGVVSYSFRNQFEADVAGTLDLIRGMGVSNIEFSNLFGKTAIELREMLDSRDMECTSYGVSFDALMGDIETVVENAKALGTKYVRVAWIPFAGPKFTLSDAQRAVDAFNNAGEILSRNGLHFCYHNHGYEFIPHADSTLFDFMVQSTSSDHVSFEMDILWVVHPGADPVYYLNKYPDRFRLLHLKDLKKGVVGNYSGSTPRENDVVLGTGQIDIPAVLKAAQHTSIEYFYIEDESPDVVERMPISLEYIRGLY
jgi:sugar phosphate isomerase/epimerase